MTRSIVIATVLVGVGVACMALLSLRGPQVKMDDRAADVKARKLAAQANELMGIDFPQSEDGWTVESLRRVVSQYSQARELLVEASELSPEQGTYTKQLRDLEDILSYVHELEPMIRKRDKIAGED